MKVYIVWFAQICENDAFIEIFATAEGAKQFIKRQKTFGREGFYYRKHDVVG